MPLTSMRPAEWINIAFFSLFVALAWIRILPSQQRTKAARIGGAGAGLTLAALYLRRLLPQLPVSVIRDWLPAPLMLLAYWQTGAFVEAPNKDFQRKLEDLDLNLLRGCAHVDHGGSLALQNYFEFSYLLCYPLIPLGLGVLYLWHLRQYADQYWAAILPATYLCYIVLPFVQALPPRLLQAGEEVQRDPSSIRRLNLWLLRHASIQVTTFPSAHVAATTAASLALLQLVPLAGFVFLLLSLGIAIGAVKGRYHYALDVLLGVGLAVVVFVLKALLL
jgi:membrane-associated phospholipid phosphatase